MAVSQVELCNIALSRAGGQRITQITSLGEASQEARQCAVKLPHLIRTALRSFAWRFASKKMPLALIVASCPSASSASQVGKNIDEAGTYFQHHILYGTAYTYQYPEDCLAILDIYSANSHTLYLGELCTEKYYTELGDDNTKRIVSPVPDAILHYTCHVTDPNIWDPLFYDALAWQLAAELAIGLGNDAQKAKSLDEKAFNAWDKAQTASVKEHNNPSFQSSYLRARL